MKLFCCFVNQPLFYQVLELQLYRFISQMNFNKNGKISHLMPLPLLLKIVLMKAFITTSLSCPTDVLDLILTSK